MCCSNPRQSQAGVGVTLPVPRALGFGAPAAVETGGKAICSRNTQRCSSLAARLVLWVDKTLQYRSLTESSFTGNAIWFPPPMYRMKCNRVYFLFSPRFPFLSLLSPPPHPGGVCVILTYVYKTGFYCYLNTSGPTRSSQAAKHGLGAVPCPLSETDRKRGHAA